MCHAIEESTTKVEYLMQLMIDQKIQSIHHLFDTFELRVLERPAPTTIALCFERT